MEQLQFVLPLKEMEMPSLRLLWIVILLIGLFLLALSHLAPNTLVGQIQELLDRGKFSMYTSSMFLGLWTFSRFLGLWQMQQKMCGMI